MPEEDGFLQRWSRRKAEGYQEEQEHVAAPPAPEEPVEESDPDSLPPVESLGPDSDFTAFLKKGVPKVLRAAALRKAWSCNVSIVAHKPLVDYDWDVNAPGFGKLWPADDTKALVEAVFRHCKKAEEESAPETGGDLPAPEEPPVEDVPEIDVPGIAEAPPQEERPAPRRPEPRPRKGGAVPV